MISFSPGVAQGCFRLLGIASRNPITFPEIRSAFSYIESLPSSTIIGTAQALNWLDVDDDGHVALTALGSRILFAPTYEQRLRFALLDYIDVARPFWIQNASVGRSRVLAFAGAEISQLFIEARLAHGTDEEVVDFWDSLAAKARSQKNDKMTLIGRCAERLTIDYEQERTGQSPKWIAIDSNADGYDVLSIVDALDDRPLSIEVKASTHGLAGYFHLTRNEWEHGVNAKNHVFYLWDIRNDDKPALAALSPADLMDHVPIESGLGVWESIKIPLRAFEQRFILKA
jgi:hypothetical protein